jgi:preprotein translocase subunit SecG
VFILVVTIHVVVCMLIIAVVLLQAGKGADIGSAFGGTGSQAVFGAMGTPTLLGKITTGVAIVFAITSFTLAMMGGQRGSSVVRDAPPVSAPTGPSGTAPATAPGTPAVPGTPAAPSAPAPATPPPPAPSTK